MSLLLLNQPSKLCFRKPVFVRSSPLLSNGFSSSLLQTPPRNIIDAVPCGADLGKLVICNANEKKEYWRGSADPGWTATLMDDGILRLRDDINASDTESKRIPLPPLVTLPHCQTQIVTNVSMSSSSPEDEDCVVAVKFLGPQLSFCRPAQSNSEWINISIANPCFFSSHVMFSEKHDMFRIPGSGGHLIGSWDLHHTHKQNPKFQRLRFRNLPKLTETKRALLDSCFTSEHLVESRTTGETFLVKWYKVAVLRGILNFRTEGFMVFKLDDKGNAVYTPDFERKNIFPLPISTFFYNNY